MSDSGSPSQSPAVRYKTYQSKRASTSSLSSIQGALFGPDPVKAASEPFVRPATPENKALLVNKPTAPSPLARPVNPSTSSLDRFPSPPLGSRPFASIQQSHLDDHSHRLGSPAPIRTASTGALPSPTRPKGKAPYLAGFQPQGVYRPRTDEFAQARDHYSENKRLERARISRRLEKLLVLHSDIARSISTANTSNAGISEALRSSSASQLWSSVRRSVQGSALRRLEDLKLAEQQVVKWQDDKSAQNCAICTIPFSLTIRKHHCRLCGRVICYVPPNSNPPPLGRTQRCSTFITPQSPASQEAPNIVVEMEDGLTEEAQAFRERHGIRVCQDCLTTVRRQQDKMHPAAPPTWYKMHELLIELQAEVDAALPALQEQILSSSATLATLTPSQRAALLASRKKILTLLASIDSLGKRIKEYPLAREHTIGGAQDRLLRSIANRSTIFLQDRMGLLKGLGSFDDLPPSAEPAGANGKRQSVVVVDLGAAQAMEARAEQLSVLLEQEKLVKSYLDDANQKRQLTDSASLQQSLSEIRDEIARLKGMP